MADPSSVRVLTRPPPSPLPSATTASAANSPTSIPVPHSPSSDSNGIVVVGFTGSRPTDDAANVINRIIDADFFGSSGKDLTLLDYDNRQQKITYFHDSNKGMLFLNHSSSCFPSSSSLIVRLLVSFEALEEYESDHLRGLLFMFSVCHVIVFLHEGLRFDTEILKKFRMLQAAKHALSPFIRSQITPNKSSASSLSQPNSVSPPGTRRINRPSSSSSISLMSGTTFRPALPGQCSPVTLFLLYDDFSNGCINPSPSSTMEDDSIESSDNSGRIPKSNVKGASSGPVVMLARHASKTEGSFRKKLQISLDTQIRFLIKKCRLLVGTEPGSRGIGSANALPLFSLDASRAVALIDRSLCHRGESLDFVIGMEDLFNARGAAEMVVSGNHHQALNNDEEVQVIRDFIYRQSDILRGKGGLQSNTNSGSVAGVGMVAAAAAAAAASASTGKSVGAPELPSFENWLSSCNLIIGALFSVKHGLLDESGNIKRQYFQSNATYMKDDQTSRRGSGASEAAVSCLEGGMGLHNKFSISWCKRALPAAKEVYLKDLPTCYPSTLHKSQLEKALQVFRSMVRGPAVEMFAKKLEDECTDIWTSGRQLCDAISLTGKPCMHQRHTVEACDSSSKSVKNQHSSGYFFLHACACGRSRFIREDPFDFTNANVDFNCLTNCEDVLPTLVLPKGSNTSPLPPSSWRLVRLGGARYYDPSKGLLQIGFCPRENSLLKWAISVDKRNGRHALPNETIVCSVIDSKARLQAATVVDEEKKKLGISKFSKDVWNGRSDNQRKAADMVSSDATNISFGKGLPSFIVKKPFSEVVAGTVHLDSTFPILKHDKQQKATVAKGGNRMGQVDQTDDQVHKTDVDHQGSRRTACNNVQDGLQRSGSNYHANCNPFLQIGSNLVPVNTCERVEELPNSSQKDITVYVGFEYECSYGHRFLLSPKHLRELDTSYSTGSSERKHEQTSSVLRDEMLPFSFRTATTDNCTKKSNRSSETTASNCQQRDRSILFSREVTDKFTTLPVSSDTLVELESNLLHVALDDDMAFSLLNRNLPVYMNCPHCKSSTRQNHHSIKFASTVCQLQRIFLVTPPFPTVLATNPVIQFEESCLLPSTLIREKKLCFTLGCQVVLPPDSFLTLKLPFVYGIQEDDGSLQPLYPLRHHPELSAWLLKNTALQIISLGHDSYEKLHM